MSDSCLTCKRKPHDGCPVGQVQLQLYPTYHIYAHAFRDLFSQRGGDE